MNSIRKKRELGKTYLYEEDKPVNSFKVFFNTVSEDVEGLCITRANPNDLKKSFPVLGKSTRIIWLTDVDSTDVTIDPNEVERLSAIITDFIYECLNKNSESIILLDGIEYIISRTSFVQTLQVIHHIKDIVSMYNTNLIIPLSPQAIDIKELKQLERELEIVRF